MEINVYSEDIQNLDKHLDTLIQSLYVALSKGNIQDGDKDTALIWMNRGKIAALNDIKALITIKDR